MITLQEMDPDVSIRDQLGETSDEPVVLVNVFHVAPEQADTLLAAWSKDTLFFKAQPGFISAQLHRGTTGSGTFLNYAVWQSVAAFRAAFGHPDFRAQLAGYPDGTTGSPHLFRKLAVDGICVA